MHGQLFWPFYDDMFTSGIPADHVMIFGAFEQATESGVRIREMWGEREAKSEWMGWKRGLLVQFCEKSGLGLDLLF